MTIPLSAAAKLSEPLWLRPVTSRVATVFTEFGIDPESNFAEFYSKYWGPFRSKSTGLELLDLVEQDESITSNTRAARDHYCIPKNLLVITSLLGGAGLVYNTNDGAVYDLDFEGGDEALYRGEIRPRWADWNEFLEIYFG